MDFNYRFYVFSTLGAVDTSRNAKSKQHIFDWFFFYLAFYLWGRGREGDGGRALAQTFILSGVVVLPPPPPSPVSHSTVPFLLVEYFWHEWQTFWREINFWLLGVGHLTIGCCASPTLTAKTFLKKCHHTFQKDSTRRKGTVE